MDINKQVDEFEYFLKNKMASVGIYSLNKLAKLVDMSQPNLYKKLKRRTLTYFEVLKIAKALNYNIQWVRDYTIIE